MEYLYPRSLPVSNCLLWDAYTHRAHCNLFVTLYPRLERGALDIARGTRGTRVTSGTVELTAFPHTICMLTRRHVERESLFAVSPRGNYQFLCRLFPYTNPSPLELSTRRSSRPSGDSTGRQRTSKEPDNFSSGSRENHSTQKR